MKNTSIITKDVFGTIGKPSKKGKKKLATIDVKVRNTLGMDKVGK